MTRNEALFADVAVLLAATVCWAVVARASQGERKLIEVVDSISPPVFLRSEHANASFNVRFINAQNLSLQASL